jgi:hypothetical protein
VSPSPRAYCWVFRMLTCDGRAFTCHNPSGPALCANSALVALPLSSNATTHGRLSFISGFRP